MMEQNRLPVSQASDGASERHGLVLVSLAPAAKVVLLSVLEPILGPVWVWAILGEHLGTPALISGGIVLSALAAHTVMDVREARPNPPAI